LSQLTQREYLFLDDALQAAKLESKCFAHLAQRCQEPALRDLCTNLAQMHQRHCERMAQYIRSGEGQPSQPQQHHQWIQSQPAYMGQR